MAKLQKNTNTVYSAGLPAIVKNVITRVAKAVPWQIHVEVKMTLHMSTYTKCVRREKYLYGCKNSGKPNKIIE